MYAFIAIYCLYVLLGNFIYRQHSHRFIRPLFFCISLLFSVLAFFFNPDINMDLYRHFQSIEFIRDNMCGIEIVFEDPLFVRQTCFYIFSLTPSIHFFPAITLFISYFLSLDLVYKMGTRYNAPIILILLSGFCIITSLNFLTIVSGVRQYLSFAVFSYFLYLESTNSIGKVKAWLVYLLLPFFHTSMFIFLFIRLMILIRGKRIYCLMKIVLLTWMFFLPIIIDVMPTFFSESMTTVLFSQIGNYTSMDDIDHMAMYFSYISLAVYLIHLILFKKIENKINGISKFFLFWEMILLFSVGSISVFILYSRLLEGFFVVFILGNMLLLNISFKNFDKFSNFFLLELFLLFIFTFVSFVYNTRNFQHVNFLIN